MSETTSRTSGGLSSLKLDELKSMASSLGITGTTRMRKSDLVEAINSRRSGGPSRPSSLPPQSSSAEDSAAQRTASPTSPGSAAPAAEPSDEQTGRPRRRAASRGAGAPAQDQLALQVDREQQPKAGRAESAASEVAPAEGRPPRSARQRDRQDPAERSVDGLAAIERAVDRAEARREQRGQSEDGERRQRGTERSDRGDRQDRTDRDRSDRQQGGRQYDDRGERHQGNRWDDDDRGGRRRGRQRNRDRKRRGQGGMGGQDFEEVQLNEDDVLVPVGGILDVLDSYAFVRTSGYLPGPNDVYVPLGIVKRHGLRKGDAVTGQVKALREGEQGQATAGRQKFNALVRLDTVNGQDPEKARTRVEFNKLTPLYPQERLHLETTSGQITTRVIDLVSPIGKGQRGLIVSPPKAGKTMVMQSIANAITTNNPEVHLMVVLVDERPEEVTDFQRSVKGEVIASTFDRPASDHTMVAELAIERAKRLVELGLDVVVLLDGITRLGRAYNLAAPASGRILSGGVDSAALYPPKRFFGAARNIENGGSLTILATALVETGSKMDEVIFEEFKGTGNMELRLSRQLADRRVFPAVDATASGTRREEILMGAEELRIMWKLRRILSTLDQQQGAEMLIAKLKKTGSNAEFLMQVQKTSSIQLDDDN